MQWIQDDWIVRTSALTRVVDVDAGAMTSRVQVLEVAGKAVAQTESDLRTRVGSDARLLAARVSIAVDLVAAEAGREFLSVDCRIDLCLDAEATLDQVAFVRVGFRRAATSLVPPKETDQRQEFAANLARDLAETLERRSRIRCCRFGTGWNLTLASLGSSLTDLRWPTVQAMDAYFSAYVPRE
jgi:hypothetical protein